MYKRFAMKDLIKWILKMVVYAFLFLNVFIASAGSVFGANGEDTNRKFLFGIFLLAVFFFRKQIWRLFRTAH